jgi:ferredoxin--NADP+ reductase
MFKIISKKILSESLKEFDVLAPHVAKNAKAGQFVVVRTDEFGERIPLTIASTDLEKGTVKIIFQEIGKSTKKLGLLDEGAYIQDFLGPLGNPSEVKKYGKVICIGGGVGIAAIYPIAKALKETGNKVISIIGVRSKEMMMLKDEMKNVSDEIFFTSNDGSLGQKGFVTDVLKDILNNEKIDIIFAVGPLVMMKAVYDYAKNFDIPVKVSLEVLMLDGIGMCGACRIKHGHDTKFACVDGPEFDASKLDFQDIMNRQKNYVQKEKEALDNF